MSLNVDSETNDRKRISILEGAFRERHMEISDSDGNAMHSVFAMDSLGSKHLCARN